MCRTTCVNIFHLFGTFGKFRLCQNPLPSLHLPHNPRYYSYIIIIMKTSSLFFTVLVVAMSTMSNLVSHAADEGVALRGSSKEDVADSKETDGNISRELFDCGTYDPNLPHPYCSWCGWC